LAGKIKVKDHEKLDDANIERVIAVFEAEKPCTIKEACEMLNITPNGARLRKIIQDYKDRLAENKKRRAANRGKPATDYEISTVIESYITGDSLKDIADRLYRSVEFVKRIIEEVGVPSALPGEGYANFSPLPEQCVSDEFAPGEFVWSSKYGAIAEVHKDLGLSNDGTNSRVYRIYVYERVDQDKMLIDGRRYSHMPEGNFGGFYANQRAYDLGSLKHLKPYVPDFKRIIK
jgi:hypothetical protein